MNVQAQSRRDMAQLAADLRAAAPDIHRRALERITDRLPEYREEHLPGYASALSREITSAMNRWLGNVPITDREVEMYRGLVTRRRRQRSSVANLRHSMHIVTAAAIEVLDERASSLPPSPGLRAARVHLTERAFAVEAEIVALVMSGDGPDETAVDSSPAAELFALALTDDVSPDRRLLDQLARTVGVDFHQAWSVLLLVDLETARLERLHQHDSSCPHADVAAARQAHDLWPNTFVVRGRRSGVRHMLVVLPARSAGGRDVLCRTAETLAAAHRVHALTLDSAPDILAARRLYHESVPLLAALPRLGRGRRVVSYDDVQEFALLAAAPRDRLEALVRRRLGPIMEMDARAQQRWIDTIFAEHDHDGSVIGASGALHLTPDGYRKRRQALERLTNRAPRELYVAALAYRLVVGDDIGWPDQSRQA